MPDPFIIERLEFITEHRKAITEYFSLIHQANDFRSSSEGKKSFDAIISRLLAIGEGIKRIEKKEPGFTERNLTQDVEIIIRFRDFIAHHYEKLDTDIIYEICNSKIPPLKNAVIHFLTKN